MTCGPRLPGSEQRVDRVQDRAVGALQASVLALVLLPRPDDEHLIEPVRVFDVVM